MSKTPRKKESRYASIITVYTRSAEALIDMMRYDCCYPASSAEASKIVALLNHADDPTDHYIDLTRMAAADLPPTIGRWKSFGILVLHERRGEDARPTDAYLEAMQAAGGLST